MKKTKHFSLILADPTASPGLIVSIVLIANQDRPQHQ